MNDYPRQEDDLYRDIRKGETENMAIRRRYDQKLREERLLGQGTAIQKESIGSLGSVPTSYSRTDLSISGSIYVLFSISFFFLALMLWSNNIPSLSGIVVLGYELPDFCLGVSILSFIGGFLPKLISVIFIIKGLWGFYFIYYYSESNQGIFYLLSDVPSLLTTISMLGIGIILLRQKKY